MAVVEGGVWWRGGGCGAKWMDGCGGGRVGAGYGGGRMGSCFGGGWVVVVEGRWGAVVRKERFAQCTATYHLPSCSSFLQTECRKVYLVCYENQFSKTTGCLPLIRVATS